MRAFFGLAGLLVVLGVIVWFMKSGGLDNTAQTLKTGQNAREQVSQIAGQDAQTGERASRSAVLEAISTGTRLNGLLVVRVTADGAYDKYFGIKRNDTIVATEHSGTRMDIKASNDAEMATAQVEESYRRGGSIYVVREGKELKLPAAAPAAAGQPPKRDSVQQQIDALQGIPR